MVRVLAKINQMKDLYGDDFVTDLLAVFLEHTPRSISQMENFWKSSDYQKLRIKAHSLKSSSLALDCISLSTLARDIEETCLGGFYDQIPGLIQQMYNAFEPLRIFLGQELSFRRRD